MFIRTPPREPAPPAVPARAERLTARQAERAFYTELVSQLQQLVQNTTAVMDRLLGRSVNDVLLVETATFDADGTISRQFRAPAGAVEVSNPNAGHAVTVSQADKSASAPTIGVGVYVVPGGTVSRTVSVATRHLTFYGTPGDTISFQVWAKGAIPAVV